MTFQRGAPSEVPSRGKIAPDDWATSKRKESLAVLVTYPNPADKEKHETQCQPRRFCVSGPGSSPLENLTASPC